MPARAESVLELRKVALGAPSEGLPGSRGQTDARLRGEVRRGMPQIFDLGIRALRDEFGWLVLVAALVWFPLRLIPLLIMADSPGETGEIVGGLLAAMNNGIAQTITTALLARRLADGYRARGALIPQPGRMLILCLPGIFGLGLVTGIATGIGMCMCLVPGIYLSFKLSLAPTVLVLEDASVGDAIRRSLYLTTTSFWRWAGLMLSIFIMAGPISGGVAILEQPFIREEVQEWAGLPAASFAWLYAGASSLFLAFAAALTSAVMTAYYLDLLERRDGVDLEQQLRELKTVEGAVR